MPDFVYDGTTLPDGKVDARPASGPANESITASEWNTVMQDIYDIRSAILAGDYHGLANNASAALSAAGGARLRQKNGAVELSVDGGAYRPISTPRFSVESFGAKGDATTDDHAAIQAAIDAAAAAGGGIVQFQDGKIYIITQPLRIRASNISLVGGHRMKAEIRQSTFRGPMIVAVPTVTFYTLGASLATGAGNSVYLRPGNVNSWFSLNESERFDLNGRAQFAIEFFWKPSGTLVDAAIISCGSRRLSTDTRQDGLRVITYSDGAMAVGARFATSGDVGFLIQGSNGTPTIGQTYHVAVTYDGATLRTFIDGVLRGSVAASGALQLSEYEQIMFGAGVDIYPEGTLWWGSPSGYLDGLRISNEARYTSAFTPPTAKPTHVPGTLFLCNFDEIIDNLILVGRGPADEKIYMPIRKSERENSLLELSIIGLRIQCNGNPGIFFQMVQQSLLRDVYVENSCYGIAMRNDSFFNAIEDCYFLATNTKAKYAYMSVGQSGANKLINTLVRGGLHPFTLGTQSSATVYGGYIFSPRPGGSNIYMRSNRGTQTSAAFYGVSVTDEDSPGVEAIAIIDGLESFRAYGGGFEVAHTASVPLFKVAGGSDIELNCDLRARADTPSLIHHIDGNAYPARPVRLPQYNLWDGRTTLKSNVAGGVSGMTQRGRATITGLDTSASVTLPIPLNTSDTYHVQVTVATAGGIPAADSYIAYVQNKTGTGFTITLRAAPGTGNSVDVDWKAEF